jgi:hypothetical protein
MDSRPGPEPGRVLFSVVLFSLEDYFIDGARFSVSSM